jgi:hypothetical protein
MPLNLKGMLRRGEKTFSSLNQAFGLAFDQHHFKSGNFDWGMKRELNYTRDVWSPQQVLRNPYICGKIVNARTPYILNFIWFLGFLLA